MGQPENIAHDRDTAALASLADISLYQRPLVERVEGQADRLVDVAAGTRGIAIVSPRVAELTRCESARAPNL